MMYQQLIGKKFSINTIFKRIFIVFGILIILLTPVGIYAWNGYNTIHNFPAEVKPFITWGNKPNTEVFLQWQTLEQTSASIEVKNLDTGETYSFSENNSSIFHQYKLTDLSPYTKYYYKVIIENNIFGDGTFRTAPSEKSISDLNYNNSFQFMLVGDTQQPKVNVGHFKRIIKDNIGKNLAFFGILGDFVDNSRVVSEYYQFFDTAEPLLKNTTIIPVIGNHDFKDQGKNFRKFFPQQVNNNSNQFYYSFDYGNVHFTICHFVYGRDYELTENQLNWLKNDLSTSQNSSFRIVMFHSPIIGSGFFGRNMILYENILPILQTYNVSILITGHEHHYERGFLRDMPYIIIGTGGGAMDPGLQKQPETEILSVSPAYLIFNVINASIIITAYSPDGVELDSIMINSDVGTNTNISPNTNNNILSNSNILSNNNTITNITVNGGA